jgi:ubiquinone/menaquinone biosynthesis C-methylase UbiE
MGIGFQLQKAAAKSRAVRCGLGVIEATLFGTRLRLATARAFMRQFYNSSYRRKWLWQNYGEPHFTDHDYTFFRLYDASLGQGVYSLVRAMNAAEHVTEGALVLDIGCGDGGFTRRFLAPKAGHVDAIDIEHSAISVAQKSGADLNITFRVLDAVKDPLPAPRYDLISMDGVIGHITLPDSETLLGKIARSLAPGGVFCGSESLGHEGHDHLQFFTNQTKLAELLQRHFRIVNIRTITYTVGSLTRHECIWSCAA